MRTPSPPATPAERCAARSPAWSPSCARRPPPPTEAAGASRRPAPAERCLSASQLEDVRDDLLDRLSALDDARAEVMRRLDELDTADELGRPEPARRRSPGPSSASLAGVRVRWVGA